MAFFQFTPDLKTGIAKIDEQHGKLIDIINEFYDAFMKKEHQEKISQIINKLIEYTEYHFKEEEKYFNVFLYNKRIEHVHEHNEFVNKVKEFHRKATENNVNVTFEVMNFLRKWLSDHIKVSDRDYIDLFKSKGL